MKSPTTVRLTRINHSCAPTAVWSSVEGQPISKEVRVVRDLQEGDEITANYVDRCNFTSKDLSFYVNFNLDKFEHKIC